VKGVGREQNIAVKKAEIFRAHLKGAFDDLVPRVVYPLPANHNL
jgi:hypothetical protein